MSLSRPRSCHARNEHGEPLFLIKGDVAIELLLGLRSTRHAPVPDRDPKPASCLSVSERLRLLRNPSWRAFATRST